MSQPTLGVIVSSVREVRKGDVVARWIAEQAREHGGFDVEVIDLADLDIPLTTHEPAHPATGDYRTSAAQYFSRVVDRCQAFVVVTPEYNHTFPASIKNALDLVFSEWNYKPVSTVTYGGMSGGIRAAEGLKQVFTTLRMFPIREDVALPMFWEQITDDAFAGTEMQVKAAAAMLDELAKVTGAVVSLQTPRARS